MPLAKKPHLEEAKEMKEQRNVSQNTVPLELEKETVKYLESPLPGPNILWDSTFQSLPKFGKYFVKD